MKKFTKFFSVLMALMLAMCFVSCSDDDDSSSSGGSGGITEAISGRYKGSLSNLSLGTAYMILTINNDYTWSSQGYDSSYSKKETVGSATGTYTRSGNTVKITGTIADLGMGLNLTCKTSDDWNTVAVTGDFSGTMTKQ